MDESLVMGGCESPVSKGGEEGECPVCICGIMGENEESSVDQGGVVGEDK